MFNLDAIPVLKVSSNETCSYGDVDESEFILGNCCNCCSVLKKCVNDVVRILKVEISNKVGLFDIGDTSVPFVKDEFET